MPFSSLLSSLSLHFLLLYRLPARVFASLVAVMFHQCFFKAAITVVCCSTTAANYRLLKTIAYILSLLLAISWTIMSLLSSYSSSIVNGHCLIGNLSECLSVLTPSNYENWWADYGCHKYTLTLNEECTLLNLYWYSAICASFVIDGTFSVPLSTCKWLFVCCTTTLVLPKLLRTEEDSQFLF